MLKTGAKKDYSICIHAYPVCMPEQPVEKTEN